MLTKKQEVKTLSVRLPKSDYDALKKLSQSRGLSINKLVRVSLWYAQFKDSNPDGFIQKRITHAKDDL